jgi:pantetheine-phosphate adenylyltransferase
VFTLGGNVSEFVPRSVLKRLHLGEPLREQVRKG